MASAYILVVDDEPDIRTLLQEILQDEGYEVATAESGEEARRLRRVRRPDLVLLDIWMPGIDGISLLKEWKEEEEDGSTPIIMMSGHGTVETAVEATRLGAYDFIEKPLSLAKLLVTVQRALEAYNLYRENVGLKRQAQPVTEPVGKSEAMRRLINQVRRIAQHDTAVLINGEPGSGKSLFARYLHDSSPRRRGPFVDVGVASLLGDNPAVELFGGEEEGHVQYGLLEQASGGTLFLDDIGDMDIATQARLLGALETGRYQRIGGSEPVETDVRIVAATRYDLEQRIAEGRFRNDLYYQLNVVPLTVVSLRQHAEDIPELLNFYVDYFVSQDNLPYRDFSVSAQNRLRHYAWPGNVRELKNLVQRLLIVGHSSQVDADEVDAALGSAKHAASPAVGVAFDLPLRQAREQFERTYFEHLLREYGGNVNQTAQHAGVERTHLYRKLRTLGIDPKQVE
ncbi:sigma-54-dependent transcriptional regulator [Thiohalomonas denitrificans]|uniref:sigma-54-dependent transcriptional regulator n=1 Tax=Thiohalomonas denitrificans TaxID=415747 RepID=UPI0026E9D15C|nr:sigma-54 dependent transcriptional regulator [Thiohalomonas denitrificans]